jgi:adenylate cyclase
MDDKPVTRRLAAILCADVKGYSHLMEKDEGATVRTLTSHWHVIDGLMDSHGGRIVSTAGDGFLAEFGSVVDAINCAVAMQNKLGEENAVLSGDSRLEFRIGVNLGDIIIQEKTVFGDGVNISARLESLAKPGSICISGSVYDQVKRKLPLSYQDAGLQKLKNIEEPVHVYHISVAEPPPPAARPLADKQAIAVLPFDNMSADAEQDYFCDGVTEDLITDLSKIPGLSVIARNSVFVYKGKHVKVQEVARDLGVKYVLEGSVRRSSSRLRITAQLIEAGTGNHLWAERFDREMTDVFAVQDEVVHNIVEALELKLAPSADQGAGRKATNSIEAYDLMLRGNQHYFLYSKDDVMKARDCYARAAELDPSYAAAFAWLARTYMLEFLSGWSESFSETLAHAYDLARKALDLDPSFAFGHAMLGWVHLWRREHDAAVAEGRIALRLDPNDAEAHAWLAWSLSWSGLPTEAFSLIEAAMRLNPHYPAIYLIVRGTALFAAGRYEEAIEILKRGIMRSPELILGYVVLAASSGLSGRDDDAKAAVAQIQRISPLMVSEFLKYHTIFKLPADNERLVEGLRRAGYE